MDVHIVYSSLNIFLSTFILLQKFSSFQKKAQNTQRSVSICINYIKVLYLNYQIKGREDKCQI